MTFQFQLVSQINAFVFSTVSAKYIVDFCNHTDIFQVQIKPGNLLHWIILSEIRGYVTNDILQLQGHA